MNGLADYAPAAQPWIFPRIPVGTPPWITGVGDYAPATSPWLLPRIPVAYVGGSLPKSPDIPMALIGHGNGASLPGGDCGCGSGCGCTGCSGMGAFDLAVPTWAATLPPPLNGYLVPGIPTVYIGLGLAALLILPAMMGGRGGRRRR